jgi:hypothetical protein
MIPVCREACGFFLNGGEDTHTERGQKPSFAYVSVGKSSLVMSRTTTGCEVHSKGNPMQGTVGSRETFWEEAGYTLFDVTSKGAHFSFGDVLFILDC